jgi:hypothetical protein
LNASSLKGEKGEKRELQMTMAKDKTVKVPKITTSVVHVVLYYAHLSS